MIILCELVDFIKVIRIKMFALYTEVSFDRFGKELRFIGVCLGDFVVVAQSWIVSLTLIRLEEVKCGILRAMVDQARERLCYQRINLTFLICLT